MDYEPLILDEFAAGFISGERFVVRKKSFKEGEFSTKWRPF